MFLIRAFVDLFRCLAMGVIRHELKGAGEAGDCTTGCNFERLRRHNLRMGYY